MVSGIKEKILNENAGSLVRIESHEDSRGLLCVAQEGREIPFEIKRIYWISGVPSASERGGHAHRRQYRLLVAVAGGFTVDTEYRGNKYSVRLETPDMGYLVAPEVWTTLHSFSEDAVCMVMSSGEYDADDYIRDYEEFLKIG